MKPVGVELKNDLLLVHCESEESDIVDYNVVVVKWKANPTLAKLVHAFQEVASTYILTDNKSLDEVEKETLEQLFRELLRDEKSE